MEKTDIELVENINNDSCSDSFLELKKRHGPLCTKMAAKYIQMLMSMGYSHEEIEQEKDVAMYRAIRTFKSGDNKSKVNTWIANNVRYHCLDLLKKFNKTNITVSINDAETTETSYSDFNINMDLNEFISSLSNNDSLIKKVFVDRYINNKKIKDIATENNLSQAMIYQYCSRYQSIIKNKLQNEEA